MRNQAVTICVSRPWRSDAAESATVRPGGGAPGLHRGAQAAAALPWSSAGCRARARGRLEPYGGLRCRSKDGAFQHAGSTPSNFEKQKSSAVASATSAAVACSAVCLYCAGKPRSRCVVSGSLGEARSCPAGGRTDATRRWAVRALCACRRHTHHASVALTTCNHPRPGGYNRTHPGRSPIRAARLRGGQRVQRATERG